MPRVGLQGAGELVNQRRLAGPVGANEGDEAAFVHAEADVVVTARAPKLFESRSTRSRDELTLRPRGLRRERPARPRRPKMATTTRTGPMSTCVGRSRAKAPLRASGTYRAKNGAHSEPTPPRMVITRSSPERCQDMKAGATNSL